MKGDAQDDVSRLTRFRVEETRLHNKGRRTPTTAVAPRAAPPSCFQLFADSGIGLVDVLMGGGGALQGNRRSSGWVLITLLHYSAPPAASCVLRPWPTFEVRPPSSVISVCLGSSGRALNNKPDFDETTSLQVQLISN